MNTNNHLRRAALLGTYAVVDGNVLVLTFPGRGSHRSGRFEGNKLIHDDGDVLIKE